MKLCHFNHFCVALGKTLRSMMFHIVFITLSPFSQPSPNKQKILCTVKNNEENYQNFLDSIGYLLLAKLSSRNPQNHCGLIVRVRFVGLSSKMEDLPEADGTTNPYNDDVPSLLVYT